MGHLIYKLLYVPRQNFDWCTQCLFIYDLFIDNVSSDYISIQRPMAPRRIILKNDFETMWKEAVVTLFQVVYQHLRGWTRNITKGIIHYTQCRERDSKRSPAKYKSDATHTCCSVKYVQFTWREINWQRTQTNGKLNGLTFPHIIYNITYRMLEWCWK
jgi:hypothetical protein